MVRKMANSLHRWQGIWIGEMMGTRPIRDFIMAVLPTEPSFANAHLITLDSKEEKDFHPLIESFRKYVRLHQSQKIRIATRIQLLQPRKRRKDRERNLMGKKRLPMSLWVRLLVQ